MAEEVRRVVLSYFVQTPNRFFPMEPHFYFPLFQFFPVSARVSLVRHLNLGRRGKIRDRQEALARVTHIRLLTAGEMRSLFPGGTLFRERFMGVTKSLVVYAGFSPAAEARPTPRNGNVSERGMSTGS